MIRERLGRYPSDLELAMFSVIWSEHCSYKSSRMHLAALPTEGPQVLVGPGENAGVIDVGDGIAIAIRIESHNHPSFIEPYQGAATGVGGILRDIFTMGARPIALMDPLFIGPLDDAHSRYLLDGIVRGVAGYGNAVGVPTVGGQITFADCYAKNPLVNVFCLGILEQRHLVLGRASGIGNLAVLLGSRTGRDGIGGVSVLASAGFSEDGVSKRPSVQIGDPYEEKRLIEACLALLAEELVVGIQDLGGAGLACATSETAARAGLGMDVDVDAIPRREPNMTPVEVMTSESQERMLAIVTPGSLVRVQELCREWEVDATVIGRVVEPVDGVGRLRVFSGTERALIADVPAAALADEAPRYDRPRAEPSDLGSRRARVPRALEEAREDASEDLLAMVIDASWIYRQYDHQLFLNTVLAPGQADATVLRLSAPGIPSTGKALALSCDASPSWCALDPRIGTSWTVAEAALNVACVGARPIGLVNCLNFGNPEHPEVMWQLTESITGMADACRALSIPVVGGNVSLYNESAGRDIDPTPVVTVVGMIDSLARRPVGIGWSAGDAVMLLGKPSSALSGSRFAVARGQSDGVLEEVDFDLHRALISLVARLASDVRVSGVHDVADGGMALGLGECAIASGLGAALEGIETLGALFSETPSRVIVSSADPDGVRELASDFGIEARVIGRAGGDRLVVPGLLDVAVRDLVSRFRARIPEALATV
jgi:phosphoribosylformylglycinamidine synthase